MAERVFTTEPEAGEHPSKQNADFKLTKCITIRTQDKSDPGNKWMQYLHVLSGQARCLSRCEKSELKLPNEGHVLLHIDIPNHRVYPLPLLITPFPCVYLISFDLDEEDKALKSIHDILKDMCAYSEQLLENVQPAVFLVGLQTEEKDRSSFTKRLQDMLGTRSYGGLIVPPGGGDLHWTGHGANFSIHDDVALLCRIQGTPCCPPTQLSYPSLACHCELHHKFKDGEPLVLYKEIEDEMADTVRDTIKSPNFEHTLKVLHSCSLIFYPPFQGFKQSETVVVRKPQHLYQLFAQVQKLSKERQRMTIGDLVATTTVNIHGKEEWFKNLCSQMGLLIELFKGKTHVFVMGLDPDYEVPERAHFSVDPLLVTYRLLTPEQKASDCLLPTPFFPTFVNAFLKKLHDHNPNQRGPLHLKRHYLCVNGKFATRIHVIEREQFIEIGLQQFNVSRPKQTNDEMVDSLQQACQDVCSIVSEAKCETAILALSSIQLGFPCKCGTPEPGEYFGEFNQDDGTITCSKCNDPKAATPQQQIWFNNIEEKVFIEPVTITEEGCNKEIRKLETAPKHQESDQGSPPGNPNPAGSCDKPSAQSSGMDTSCTGDPEVSFAILTANENERQAVNHFLRLNDIDTMEHPRARGRTCADDAGLKGAADIKCHPENADIPYPHFYLDVKGKKEIGVHVSCSKIGPWGAFDKTVELLKTAKDKKWKLHWIFLVGCCGASVKDKTKYPRGTILVAKQVKNYLSAGKVEGDKVTGYTEFLEMDNKWLSKFLEVREGDHKCPDTIQVELVDYLTGPLVIKDDLFGKAYCEFSPRVTGVEMEVMGVRKAVDTFHIISGDPKVKFVLAKGISDYTGGKGKHGDCKLFGEDVKDVDDDSLQVYATLQSIALVIRFVAKNMELIFE